MRKNQMYKLIYGLTIFIILLSGCNSIDNPQSTTMITNVSIETSSPIPSIKTNISQDGSNSSYVTAEETVQQFFNYWKEKNSQGMDSLVIQNMKGTDAQLDYLNSITLDSCVERTDKGNWDTLWYEKPYDYTCVDVTFTISYKKDAVIALSNGTYDWEYYLVKELEDSNWIIVMWGAKEGE